MRSLESPKRIILAVDLKSQEPKLTERIWAVLEPLLRDTEVSVEPVTVLNREDAAMGAYFQNRIGSLRAATERHLGERLSQLGIKGLAPPKVLFADGSSTQRAVSALLRHAKKTDCELIAVSSRSRRGMKRFFLGSFAESLSLQSSIPLLVVNPNQKPVAGRLNRILFPTDFSHESKQVLNYVCDAFRSTKPKLTLLHVYLPPVPVYVEPYTAYSLPQAAIEEGYEAARKLAEDWCGQLRVRGFACEATVERRASSISDWILRAAKRDKAGLIAMVSRTGKWGARFLGSVTRQVLRRSERPVWIVPPSRRSEAGKIVKFKRPSHGKRIAPGEVEWGG